MKITEALPAKYLGKSDFEPAILCKIKTVQIEEVKGAGGREDLPVLYMKDPSSYVDLKRGIILNKGNFKRIIAITGEEDTDDWPGREIVIFNDPDVEFGGEVTGGIRIRAPKQEQSPATMTEPPDEETDSPAAGDGPVDMGVESPF